MYKLSFYDLDPAMAWRCQAPRHGEPAPAAALAFFVLASELARGNVVVHQASYVCTKCRARMEADL